MNRPHVKINRPNQLDELLAALQQTLPRFTALQGVAGIVLDGGLSRGYGDHLSEIDVLIFLHTPQYQHYSAGNCPFALGITMLDGYLYDLKLLDYEQELARAYDQVGLWDLSYARILHDPAGELAAFLAQKLARKVEPMQAAEYLWLAYWHFRLAGDIWLYREDAAQGHLLLNEAVTPLLQALFIANGEYVPHAKWLAHFSRSLAWQPEDWPQRLQAALATGDFSLAALRQRQAALDSLWQEIDARLCGLAGLQNGLSLAQKASYDTLSKLVQKPQYTLAEWQEISSLEALNYEPLHSFFRRQGETVVFEREKLLNLQPEDMYVWLRQVPEVVREEL